jgi:hypothetical protein
MLQTTGEMLRLRPKRIAPSDMRHYMLAVAVAALAGTATAQITDIQVDQYLESTLVNSLETKEEALDRWKARYANLSENDHDDNIVAELIGYQPPNFLALVADISSHLYERTGEERYAEITRDLLVEIPDLRSYFPEEFRTRVEYADGVPAVNWFRTLPVYAIAYMRTKESRAFTPANHRTIAEAIASSVDIIFAHPEWGAMNRALLRAESYMAASKALPDHPSAAKWRKMSEILAGDNIGKWEIEDASIYHAVWLRSYIGFVDLAGVSDAFDSPMFKFYFDYLQALLAPNGTVPEFGDGRWNTGLFEYYLVMERGSREYQSGEMKWVAERMLERMGGLARTPAGDLLPGSAFDEPNVSFARTLINRRLHGDPFLASEIPTNVSGDAIDEIISKKVVFRSGFEEDDTFLLLNYKDEGYSSLMQKDYLKHVLAVEEEKMHHGHSDENSISMFMKDGAILLYDAGYRPYAPSGEFGAWRSDFFHNRVVVRNQTKAANQAYFDVLLNQGAYNDAVQTTKMDFQNLPGIEYSRTRLLDAKTGYRWDRVLARDLEEDFFVVVDAVKFLEDNYFTVANLWHTRQIVEQGPGWFVTRYDSLSGVDANPGELDLLVIFPYDRDTDTAPINRSYQDEIALFQGESQFFHAGEAEPFVTILYPIEPGSDAQAIADRFGLARHDGRGVAVSISRGGATELIGVKLDYEQDLLKENIRPRYTIESSSVEYGPVTTDADFFHLVPGTSPKFSATHLAHFALENNVLFEAPESQFFQTWGKSDRTGRGKWRRWDNY